MASALPTLTTGPRPPAALPAAPPPVPRLASPVAALVLGLALTLAQLALVCLLSGRTTAAAAYGSLYCWDSTWYARIAEQGYPDTLPETPQEMGKIGFFPGQPLAAMAVARLGGLGGAEGTLLASQLACWGFWTYFLLFARRWNVPTPVVAAGALAIFVQPCAFFLVVGYAEALFLLGVLGFLYWSGVRGPVGWTLAALHGVVMTGTRIVGLPLAVCPLLVAAVTLFAEPASRQGWFRRLAAPALLAGAASLGAGLYFAFCAWHYGHWDAYMRVQHAIWGVTPDYLALFKPEVYRVAVPRWVNGLVNPNDLSRLCVPATVGLFGVLALVECRLARTDATRGWRQRLGLYLAAGLMFYLAVAGVANRYLISMVRYAFCVHVLLILAVLHLLSRVELPRGRWRAALAVPLVGAAALSLTFESMLVLLFTHWEWVA